MKNILLSFYDEFHYSITLIWYLIMYICVQVILKLHMHMHEYNSYHYKVNGTNMWPF